MASKYGEYSRARDIARKRLERLNTAGYVAGDISFPTVKQLKERGISPGTALRAVEQFLNAPTKLIEFRKQPTEKLAFRQTASGVQLGEREREMKRARDARYRERVRQLTKDDKRFMKAARRLGLNITPSTAKAFTEYVKYRHAQGIGSVKYWMANIVEDYMEATQNKPKTGEAVLADYQRFLADRADLLSASAEIGNSPTAQTSDLFNVSWLEFIRSRG